MTKYITDISAQALLNSWLNAGLIPESEFIPLEIFIISQQQEKELPLYMRILVGVGAFISSLSFIAFLSISEIINFKSEAGLIFWGLAFVGLAIFLVKTSGDRNNTVSHSFLIQSSFCAMGVGKILFVIGFTVMFGRKDSGWGVTLATLLITAATYHVYRMSVDRFLSVLAVFVSLLINIVADERYFGTYTGIVLNLFFFIQIILAAILFTSGRIKRDYIPLAYAAAFSLCITVIFFAAGSKLGWLWQTRNYSMTFINILLSLSLVVLIGWAAGSAEKLKTGPLMLASLGAILLGIVSAPGVILSICLMVLGYSKHENLMMMMGILLMPVFVFLYYYNLDTTLIAKSEILVASGVVLLAGRGYLALKRGQI